MSDVVITTKPEITTVRFKNVKPTPSDHLFLQRIVRLNKVSEVEYHQRALAPPQLKALRDYLEKRYSVELEGTAEETIRAFLETEADIEERVRLAAKIKAKPPKTFDAPRLARPLLAHQRGPAAHLAVLRHAANFSVPGAGKTSVVLAAYNRLCEEGIVEKILVVCPRAAFRPWEDEFEASFGATPSTARIQGTPIERRRIYNNSAGRELFLCTYQMLTNEVEEVEQMLARYRFMVVLDESHYAKKLRGGKWVTAILRIAPLARSRVILSGTPMPNGLEDLWSQMTFLYPDRRIFGSQEQYQARLAKGDNIERVRKDIRPFYWRVRKKDLDLPKPRIIPTRVPLAPIQSRIYEALAVKILDEVVTARRDQIRFRDWRRAKVVRLLQAASNPTLLARAADEFSIPPLSPDALGLGDIVEDYAKYETPTKFAVVRKITDTLLAAGPKEKVVVWTSFVHNLEMLDTAFEDVKHVVVHGGIARDSSENEEENRETLIHDFKHDPDTRILFANPGACAESISLHTACTKAIFMDRTFNAAQFLQAMDRTHRVGLPKDALVEYYVLKTDDTIDYIIDARLAEKANLMREVLEGDITQDRGSADEWSDTEIDEERDFEAVLRDLKRRYG